MSVSKAVTTECYLCGQRPAVTRDHVFPRLLFPKGRAPTNLPTLPACIQCNNQLSEYEEAFQHLILSGRALDTAVARAVWDTKVRPSLNNNKRRSRQTLLSHVEIQKAVTFWEHQLHDWPVLNVSRDVVDQVLGKIAKGLYFLEFGHRLPEDVRIEVWFAQDRYERLVDPELMPFVRKSEVAKDILTYWRVVAADKPTASITWFVFYHWNMFCVITTPPDRV